MKNVFLLTVNILYCASAIFVYKNGSDNDSAYNFKQVYNSEGHLKVALLANECVNTPKILWTYINSAIWTINKLNSLNFTSPLQLGLTVFQTCSEVDYYNPIYKLFKEDTNNYLLGVISTNTYSPKIRNFANSLDINLRIIDKYRRQLVEAVVKLLSTLDVTKNVTVYCESQSILQEFYKYTRDAKICVRNAYILNNDFIRNFEMVENSTTMVVFAGSVNMKALISNFSYIEADTIQVIFAPFDENETIEFPEGSLIVQVPYALNDSMFNESTPLLFEVANPILNLALNVSHFINENCNETVYKFNCLRNGYPKTTERQYLKFTQFQMLCLLKSENLQDSFIYQILRKENFNLGNVTFSNTLNYKLFGSAFVGQNNYHNSTMGGHQLCVNCRLNCMNFKYNEFPKSISVVNIFAYLELRTDSWVFGILAISILGVSFCLAIFIFLIIRFCKRDILEGNPALTLFLLISVILMYCSVIPFSLYSDKEFQMTLCIIRALSSTLSYAFALSLLLARSILLATINKEVGFMAHISGPVQSFLTLFIFGVQGALSLHFLSHCQDVFRGISFIYLMSYNIILLVLLVFISPLNARVHRNYKEGKYFTIAVALIACAWSCWIPGYAVLKETWRDPILCIGLISTASILLGSIFIPRTYMMTVSATRDRIANALPSLPTSSSIMDVYRVNGQPIYDCINIAAINAATLTRSIAPPPPPEPQIYSRIAAPAYDDDYDFERCITPSNSDKVTRF